MNNDLPLRAGMTSRRYAKQAVRAFKADDACPAHAPLKMLALLVFAAAIAGCGGGGGSGGGGNVIPSFVSPANVTISDINRDGAPDIVVSAATVQSAPPHAGFVAVLTQKPQARGTFSASIRYAAEFDPSGLAVADLSGSGAEDVVVGSLNKAGATLPDNIVVLRHDPGNAGALLSPQLLSTGSHGINDVAVGDVNGDGLPDIVVTTNPTSAGATILVFTQSNTQPGTFVLSQSIVTATRSGAIALADLNGDGRLDIAVTSAVDNAPGTMQVFLQNASTPGTFLAPTGYAVGLQPVALAVGDLNGDGKPDLAVVNQGAGDGSNPSVSVLLQNAAMPGQFSNQISLPAARAPMAIAIADIDGDGKQDIVTANASGAPPFDGSVQIYFQQAPGAFGSPVKLGSFQGSYTLAVGDLNGDQAPDIVVNDGEGIAILFQNGKARGQFQPAVHVAL